MKGSPPKVLPLIVQKSEFPTLDGSGVFGKTVSRRGVALFTEISMPEDRSIPPSSQRSVSDTIGLRWQGLAELQTDHAHGVVYGALNRDNSENRTSRQNVELTAEIRAKISTCAWEKFERYYSHLCQGDDEAGHGRIFLVAAWAELFAEPFGEVWLAAMAKHAYYVEKDDFAFGYLAALLDQKRINESDLVRGDATLRAAQSGGKMRSSALKPKRSAVLAEMSRLISDGHTAKGAAAATARLGNGTSQNANLALWYRHQKKA